MEKGSSGAVDTHHPDPELRIRALEDAVAHKDAALREVQHRAKNGLQLAISLLRLQVGRMRDPDARAAFEATLHRIEALCLVYRQLHQTGAEAEVDLSQYLSELAALASSSVEDPFGATHFDVSVVAVPLAVGLGTAMTLGLVVNELILAAQRHAAVGRLQVQITLERLTGERARLILMDNGRALPAGLDPATDDAMMLVHALAGQLGATLEFDTVQGSRALLVFPALP